MDWDLKILNFEFFNLWEVGGEGGGGGGVLLSEPTWLSPSYP